MRKKHFLVIGGGLAGTFLAARLLQEGMSVALIDDENPKSASRVAAGLYNVITGRFGAKSWMAETLLATVRSFFEQAEFSSLAQWVHPTKIYRPFKSIAEYNKWSGRIAGDAYKHLVTFQEHPVWEDRIQNEYGGIFINPCGWVELGPLLKNLKELLISQWGLAYHKGFLPFSEINIAKQFVRLGDTSLGFDEIVFCEGFLGKENPLFPGFPIIPNKGELLVIESKDLQLPWVLSRKIYLIPLGGYTYLTGSTYRNSFVGLAPSKEGKLEIESHLEKAIHVPFSVVDHIAGIRPTTPDRRPILGTHPQHSYVHVFTGFGTKGVLLAPYFSQIMTDYLLGASDFLPKEVQLNRF